MKIKHILIFLMLSFLLVFAYGCNKIEGGKKTTTGAFIGGTQGLSLDFLSGAPPESVFDTNNPFAINVKIKNIGEWDIPRDKATITVTGINPNDFGVTPSDLSKNPTEDLTGSKKDPSGNIIEGTTTNLEYDNLQYQEIGRAHV